MDIFAIINTAVAVLLVTTFAVAMIVGFLGNAKANHDMGKLVYGSRWRTVRKNRRGMRPSSADDYAEHARNTAIMGMFSDRDD